MRRSVLVLLSLCVSIVGCSTAEDGQDAQIGAYSLYDPVATNPSLCGGPAIPFPNNALFADGTQPTGLTPDTTLNIPSTASTAVAANLTDGWSTTASAFTDVLGVIDFSSTTDGLYILEADASPRFLVEGVDYELQPSIALAQQSGTGGIPATACALVNPFPARFLPISQQRTRILIEPRKPLAASTTYIVVVTKGLKSVDGVSTTPNEFFPIVNSDTKLCRLTSGEAGTELLCTAAGAAAAAAAATGAEVLFNLDPGGAIDAATATVKLITLETLRRNLVRPTVLAFRQLASAIAGPTIPDEDIVIAWSFTTQSISATLATLNAITTAKTFTGAFFPNAGPGDLDLNGRLGTGELGIAGIANTADIWVGTFNAVPYYLNDAGSTTDTAPLTDYWRNNGAVTSTANGGFVPFTPPGDYDANPATPPTPSPCSGPPFNFQRPFNTSLGIPESTTNCYRIPLEQTQENLPVIITVPKTAKPANGWPVVIFQHGITGNRTQMIPLGATLATAGFVTVAIDLPLHGLVGPLSPTNPFYQAGNERTFDLNLVTQVVVSGTCVTTAATPDANTDCSGTHFINLSSLITARDNIRQAEVDLIHLSKSMGDAALNFDGAAGNDLDLTNGIRFAGLSLGSIVGTTVLGVDTGADPAADGTDERISAAMVSVPGGGLGKLLDASASFGPVIAGGLAATAFPANPALTPPGASSPFEGTDTYETFVRFAQHLVDPGDPINYAVRANANHRILMHEVIDDTVVPNSAFSTCPAPADLAPGIGGTPATDNTNPNTVQAACDASVLLVGTNSLTQAACNGGTLATGVCSQTTTPVTQDETLITGWLSGTEPLFGEMGLTVVGPITPATGATAPPACANNTAAGGLDHVVQFAIGTHGSLLTPAGSGGATQFLAVTTEMQRQTATFLASNGVTLAGPGCP